MNKRNQVRRVGFRESVACANVVRVLPVELDAVKGVLRRKIEDRVGERSAVLRRGDEVGEESAAWYM